MTNILSAVQESIYYDTRHFLRFRDLTIQYKHYLDTGEPSTEPLIIQNVPIWAKVEETDNEDASENLESVQGTNDEGEFPRQMAGSVNCLHPLCPSYIAYFKDDHGSLLIFVFSFSTFGDIKQLAFFLDSVRNIS